ncbi:MAG: hypothetical protein K6G33_03625 [Ruminococcus sp.]|uniref:hypothetical protein n=1 Tax=Ruminococcus sp. TaxID=41978 RepID=UPI0025EBEE81|nr:hypothetical protein [Ruminococcus sp.]MCR5599820.1 hypothetical protein [Ruminococcus sp.]
MKKSALKLTLAFLLAVCTLTGCGDSSSSDKDSGKESKVETTTAAEKTTEESTTEEAATEGSTEEKTTTSKDTDASPAAEGTDFKRGVVENNVYTNEFAGIKLTAPDGWKFADDETILKMMNLGAETAYSDNADLVKKIVEQATISDALCMNSTSTQNITITYENLNKNIVLNTDTTADDYYAILEAQLSAVPTIKYTKTSGPETIQMAGKDFLKAVFKAEMNNIELEQAYYLRREGDFILLISCTAYNMDDDISTFENYFSAAE